MTNEPINLTINVNSESVKDATRDLESLSEAAKRAQEAMGECLRRAMLPDGILASRSVSNECPWANGKPGVVGDLLQTYPQEYVQLAGSLTAIQNLMNSELGLRHLPMEDLKRLSAFLKYGLNAVSRLELAAKASPSPATEGPA